MMSSFFHGMGANLYLQESDSFRNVVDLQKKYVPSGRKILNGIQTNGTLLDEEWCRFLTEENFIVGISIDGPEQMHDKYRLSAEGKPSFGKALNGL